MLLPRLDFLLHFRHIVDSSIKALVDEYIEFDFGHIEPTAVSGCVDKLETIQQRFGCLRWKCFIDRSGSVSIQIVHNEYDLFRIGILPGNGRQKICPVCFSPTLGDRSDSLTGQRFDRYENAAHAAAFIFIIMSCGHTASVYQRQTGFPDQLPW